MPLLYDLESGPIEIAPGRGDLRYSSVPFGASVNARSVAMTGGKTVSFARIFAEQPLVAMAVMRMLTWAVRVPLKVYRRTGDDSRERLRSADHPLARAVVDPWDRASMAQLTMSLLGPILVHGNAIDEVLSGASDRITFKPADWRFTTPIVPFRDSVSGWTLDEDGDKREVGADTMLHLAWWSPLGPCGISPLQQLGVTLNIEDAAQRYQKSLFANGARPPSSIQASTEFLGIDRGERELLLAQLRADITELYAGPDNAGRPALLPPGLEWKPIGHTAVEAELIDQRKVAAIEVCGVYQIPPPMLGILDKATFSNIEIQREMAYTWVEPHLGAPGCTVALGLLDGEPVASALALRTDGRAGPCLYVGGVAVLPAARRRGVGARITSWLLERGFAGGAELGHLHADTDAAARIYARLGFLETAGFDVYVGL